MAVFNEEGDIYPQCPMTGFDTSVVDIEAELQKEELLQQQPLAESRYTLTSSGSGKHSDVEDGDDTGDEKDEKEEEEQSMDSIEDAQNNPPVLASVVVTFAWLFVLPAFFLIWEDWDYFTSFYFFFVSLSTIGFGDVTPEYPQYMIMNFGLVIVGLALVSVCINVVQQKIVDLYMTFLFSILDDYQKVPSNTWRNPCSTIQPIRTLVDEGRKGKRVQAKESGQNEMDASVGMMQMWQNNKKVKFLMPLLGKDKRKVVMAKFQDEAKAQGIELPSILTNMDPDSGLPAAFDVKEEDLDEWKEENKDAIVEPELPEMVDVGVQVDVHRESLDAQTESMVALESVLSQTSLSKLGLGEEREQQTHASMFEIREATSQTLVRETSSSLMQTAAASVFSLTEGGSQTHVLPSESRLVQTTSSTFRVREGGSQTKPRPLSDSGGQAGPSWWAQVSSQSQTRLLTLDSTGLQAGSSLASLRETASLASCPMSDDGSQAGASLWSLRDVGALATARLDHASLQAGPSYDDFRDASSLASVPCSEAGAQAAPSTSDQSAEAIVPTGDSSLQAGHSAWAVSDVGSSAAAPTAESTQQSGASWAELRDAASVALPETGDAEEQAGASSFALVEAGSLAAVEGTESGMQAGASGFQLREAGSLASVFSEEVSMQAGPSADQFFDRGAEAIVYQDEAESQTLVSMGSIAEFGSQTELRTADAESLAAVEGTETGMQAGTSGSQLLDTGSLASVASEEVSMQAGPSADELFDRGAEAVVYQEEAESQTLLSLGSVAELGSQTELRTSEAGGQSGASAWSLAEAGTLAVAPWAEAAAQATVPVAESGSQGGAEEAAAFAQTSQSYFDLRESEAQTPTRELTEAAAQMGSSSFGLSSGGWQTEGAEMAEVETETIRVRSSSSRQQTDSSFFARAERASLTDLYELGLRPHTKDAETQAGILSRVSHLSQRQDSPSTSQPAPTIALRKTGFNPGRQHSLVKSDDESRYSSAQSYHSSSSESHDTRVSEKERRRIAQEAQHGKHAERQKSVKSLQKRWERKSTRTKPARVARQPSEDDDRSPSHSRRGSSDLSGTSGLSRKPTITERKPKPPS